MRYVSQWGMAAAVSGLTLLGGCQVFGPNSIGLSRDRYNGIIQSTSMEQTMSNIVRAYNHEPTLFMDVTEVDSTLSVGGSVTGSAASLGAVTGALGAAGTTMQYSETPTVRYQPLLGQALVGQLVTPVSVDALGQLYDSTWDIASVLDLSAAYITLDIREFYPALNTISELNHLEAIELVAGPSRLTAKAPSAETKQSAGTTTTGSSPNDSLIIFLRPFRSYEGERDISEKRRALQLWIRLFRIYADSQPAFKAPQKCVALGLTPEKSTLRDWDINIDRHVSGSDTQQSHLLDSARDCVPDSIELRTATVPSENRTAGFVSAISRAPSLRTYSALGIIKNATERPGPKIEFVTPDQYRQIRDHAWNADIDSLSYYTLLSGDLDSINCSAARRSSGGCDNPLPSDKSVKISADIDSWIENSAAEDDEHPDGVDIYETKNKDILDGEYTDYNGRLGTLRRYILIIVDDRLPSGPVYVSYSEGGKYYYIAQDDAVSEKNFYLISLFMTMMAIPPSTPPLSPVIKVGGP